jgi:hypothetical protein
MKKETTKITLTIPTELWERVKAQAEKEHRPYNGQTVWMLEQMLKQIENQDS